MTVTGLRTSHKSREGMPGLFDHILGLLQDEISVVPVVYGEQGDVTPFYTASFPKSYNNLPSVTMDIVSNRQTELGIGQMAAGPAFGDELGVRNTSQVQLEVWGRNRLEMEAVANAVIRTIQRRKRRLSANGVLKIALFRTYDRPYDPNAPRMWFGSMQAPGEIWAKIIIYMVTWDYTWSPVEEDLPGDIKQIEIVADKDGTVLSYNMGLAIIGILDSMFYTPHLGRNIKVIRTGGRY